MIFGLSPYKAAISQRAYAVSEERLQCRCAAFHWMQIFTFDWESKAGAICFLTHLKPLHAAGGIGKDTWTGRGEEKINFLTDQTHESVHLCKHLMVDQKEKDGVIIKLQD